MAAGELVRRRRTRGLDLEPVDALGALPDEAVLPEREAVPRGQRVREDVVGEGAHRPNCRGRVSSGPPPRIRCAVVAGRLDGKRGLVLGVANKRSIAWSIAQRLAEEGASLAFTYQGERIEAGVRELADTVAARSSRPATCAPTRT